MTTEGNGRLYRALSPPPYAGAQMRLRDRLLLCALGAAFLAAVVVHGLVAMDADALTVVPALLFLLALAAGRYVGSEKLLRFGRRAPWRAGRRRARPSSARRIVRRVAPHGGLLVAVSLARRGPPASVLAR